MNELAHLGHEERPPWETYQPKMREQEVVNRDKEGNVLSCDLVQVLVLDQKAEYAAGLRPNTLGERLRLNGVAEVALQRILALVQNPFTSEKVALEAAKYLLSHAYGNSISIERDTGAVQVMVVNNMPAPKDVQDRMDSNKAIIYDMGEE